MLSLFKGELSMTDILEMPYKRLLDLRSARERALIEERKQIDAQRVEAERQSARQRILQK